MSYKEKFKNFINTNPKRVFYGMLIIIAVSLVFAIYQHVTYEPPVIDRENLNLGSGIDPLTRGVNGIFDATNAIAKVKEIEEEINELLSKESLTRNDSLYIISKYEELEKIINQLKSSQYE